MIFVSIFHRSHLSRILLRAELKCCSDAIMSQTRTFKQSRKAIEPERTKQSQREPDRARESHREPDRATESHSWSQLSFDNNEEENVDGAGDGERVGRGRGCSFYLYLPICEFSLFFET